MARFKACLLGFLIIVKVLLPFIIIGVAVTASTITGTIVKTEVDKVKGKISAQIEKASAQVQIVKMESQRLLEEARTIKDEAKEFSQDVKDIVKPLKGALNGLSKSMGTIARTIQNVINAIIRAVNKLPFRDIPKVRLKVSDEAYEAMRQLSEVSYHVASEAGKTLESIGKVIRVWWVVAQVTFLLIVLWAILGIMGYVARSKQRFLSGWKMIRGEPVENGMALL